MLLFFTSVILNFVAIQLYVYLTKQLLFFIVELSSFFLVLQVYWRDEIRKRFLYVTIKVCIIFTGELLVIVEYCRYGNIHNYLLRNRKQFINQINPNTGKLDASINNVMSNAGSSMSGFHR